MSQMLLGRCREACGLSSFICFPFSSLTTSGRYQRGVCPSMRSWKGCPRGREGCTSASTGEHLLAFGGHRASKVSCSAVYTSINFRFIRAQSFLEITSLKTTAKHREKHKMLPRKCNSCGVGCPWLTGKPCTSFLQVWVLAALLASN